jgi:GNAT superfamily N-acetyltransferase
MLVLSEHCAVKLATDPNGDLYKTVRTIFQKGFSCFHRDDLIVVRRDRGQIRIRYVATTISSDPGDITGVQLRLGFDANEMWIGSLTVGAPFRSLGLGKQLAQSVERLARELKLSFIHLFPLVAARSFWSKLGYRPHPRMARVLRKDVAADVAERAGLPLGTGASDLSLLASHR